MGSIADRLERTRAELWVGRAAELATLRALASDTDAPHVAFVHGPGGIGKTTLLERFASEAATMGRRVLRVDARHVRPSVDAFVDALGRALGGSDDPIAALAGDRTIALLVDTWETIAALEPWLREELLPALPQSTLVVLAGRHPPSPRWRADPGWAGVLTTIELRDLDEHESRELLRRRGVPDPATAALARAAHGHPLALALAAEVARTRPTSFDALPDDIVRALLDSFLEDVPSQRHRDALYVCAIARATDEALLSRALEGDDAAMLFEWLRRLPFVTTASDGLFPHDLAREVLARDLVQRDAVRHHALVARVREHALDRLGAARAETRNTAIYDLMFAARHWPGVAGFVEFRREDAGYMERARPADAEAIAAFFAEHEGAESVRWVSYWLSHAIESFVVFRGPNRELIGALCMLESTPRERDRDCEDPALAAAWAHMDRHAPVRPDERILYTRFWGVRGAYQRVSPTQDLVQAHVAAGWLTRPQLSWSFVATRRPEIWASQFQALGMPAAEDAAFEIDGVRHTVYAHDWRRVTPQQWLRTPRMSNAAPAREPSPALSHDAFATAVRAALRDFTRTRLLGASPLLQCRALASGGGVEALRAWIRDAAAELDEHPRDRKLLRAIEVTYFKAAPTQEAAAERLGLPFGTYRRHLVRGVDRLVEILWDRERGA